MLQITIVEKCIYIYIHAYFVVFHFYLKKTFVIAYKIVTEKHPWRTYHLHEGRMIIFVSDKKKQSEK